jgi:glycosyltransferase involved in cell wall biosynthesis
MPELTVVVEQCLASVPGGTGRYAREITAALAAAPRPGWRVRTVSAWHRDVLPAVIPAADGPHRLPAGHRVLSRLWERGLPPCVSGSSVHATTPLAPRGNPLVVTVHDAVPWTHPETLTPRGVYWHKVMVSRAMTRADAVVVPSAAVADDLAGLFPAASGRLHIIGHGVTALDPPDDAPARRARWNLPERYVLTVATLEPRKGLDVLVRAMALPAAGGAHLVIVGPTGWGSVDLAAAASAAGLAADRWRALGRIDDADLAAVLQGAGVLAAPSRAEGFGLPVLEAMAAGVPVICSDAPALVEVTGGAAVVVRRDDPVALAGAIAGVLGDRAAATALAAKGRIRAAAFSWPAAARAVWDLHAGSAAVRGSSGTPFGGAPPSGPHCGVGDGS